MALLNAWGDAKTTAHYKKKGQKTCTREDRFNVTQNRYRSSGKAN
jgi:hypothetical protein